MRNLAGQQECDEYIKDELERARIPVEHAPAHRNEVPYTLMGRLGEIAFSRAWTYWVADGMVPLEIAEELYDDPVGKTDIRVAGHAGAPPPAEWARWVTPGGAEVSPADQEADYRAFYERHPKATPMNEAFSDNPEELGARLGVTSYHIDTEVGLRLFADTLKVHSLAGEPVQT